VPPLVKPENVGWMSKLSPQAKQLPLSHLSIPGSHDSCTSSLVPGSIPGVDQPKIIRDLAARFPRLAKFFLSKWSFTQHCDVLTQLNIGIRYMDIRCVANQQDGEIRVIHCLIGDTIQQILLQVKQFIEQNPGEVVILDFQHLYSFTCEDHAWLNITLLSTFGAKLCPRPEPGQKFPSLQYLQDSGFQLIVIYPNELSPFYWNRSFCPTPWPNTTSARFLKDFLTDKTKNRDKDFLFVSQGVFTPKLSTILKNPDSDLEHLSKPCNATIKSWLSTYPETQDDKPNIVITDFVACSQTSIDIIDALINMNR